MSPFWIVVASSGRMKSSFSWRHPSYKSLPLDNCAFPSQHFQLRCFFTVLSVLLNICIITLLPCLRKRCHGLVIRLRLRILNFIRCRSGKMEPSMTRRWDLTGKRWQSCSFTCFQTRLERNFLPVDHYIHLLVALLTFASRKKLLRVIVPIESEVKLFTPPENCRVN